MKTVQKQKKLMAWRLRKQQAERSIFKIRDPRNKMICHKLEEIQQAFERYYKGIIYSEKPYSPCKHTIVFTHIGFTVNWINTKQNINSKYNNRGNK